ncbi:MAG: hypothetical protein ACI31D_05260, partial [Candidatus Limisoma sp.]
MKRKNYILLLAAAMLASSCANDDVIDTSAKVEMKFRVTADSPTRAANAYCNNNLPETFTLCCDQTGSLVPIFDYLQLTRVGDTNEYSFDDPNYRYWPEGSYFTYLFYASNAKIPTTIPKTSEDWASYNPDE